MEDNKLNGNVQVPESSKEEESGLSIKQILYIVKKHILAIIIFLVVGAGLGFAGAKVLQTVAPKYTANGSMMVSVDNENISASQAYQYSSYIKDTFVVFMKEDVVIDPVAETYKDKGYTTRAIKGSLSISLKNDSLVLSASFTSKDPELSRDILWDVMKNAEAVANTKNTNGTARYKLLYENLSPLCTKESIKITVASNTIKYTAIGFAAGAVLAFAFVALKEMFDTSFKSSAEIEKELGIPVIAEIPYYEFKDENDPHHNSSNKGGK